MNSAHRWPNQAGFHHGKINVPLSSFLAVIALAEIMHRSTYRHRNVIPRALQNLNPTFGRELSNLSDD